MRGVGIFVSFFLAACHVQWVKSSEGRGLNNILALATGFFGVTVTAVSEKRNSRSGTHTVVHL